MQVSQLHSCNFQLGKRVMQVAAGELGGHFGDVAVTLGMWGHFGDVAVTLGMWGHFEDACNGHSELEMPGVDIGMPAMDIVSWRCLEWTLGCLQWTL